MKKMPPGAYPAMKEGSPAEEALDRKQAKGAPKAKPMPFAFGKKKPAAGQKAFLKKK